VSAAHGAYLENRSHKSGEIDFHPLIVLTTHGVYLENTGHGSGKRIFIVSLRVSRAWRLILKTIQSEKFP
jgi:hypothetical protein